ncbi:MAG TPA: TonB-dependent receptor, partial [Chitinophagales bacterium]|nr:TonB-dependent receptor [Chitinophagales bacterium]
VNLTGTINNDKGAPVPGATVFVNELGVGTGTDNAGTYRLLLKSGNYTLKIEAPGAVSKTETVTLDSTDKQLNIVVNATEQTTLPVAEQTTTTEPPVVKEQPAEPTTVATTTEGIPLTGTIIDEKGNVPMMGVRISTKVKGNAVGTLTDMDGKYELKLPAGTYTLEFSYLGYAKRTQLVTITAFDKEKKLDLKMTEDVVEMDIVVVTGTKYEKKLSEEVTSMEVLKAAVINQNNAKMDEAMNKVPGVNMLGKTIAIRGGSGFSDATGNRVLALLDEMPIISPENGSIRWETVPIEALEQVEIIKGSSSALYGSSALNGVLNMRTINPKPEAVNKILIHYGFYGQPYQHTWNSWWHRKTVKRNGDTTDRVQNPMFGGAQFLHAKQYGDFGVVVSGGYNQDQGFRQNNDYKRVRMSAKLRYTPKKLSNLTVGLNMNFFHENLKDFFVSKGIATAMYVPTEVVTTRTRTFNFDPYINYYDKKENRHSIKFRIYNTMYNSNAGVSLGGTGDSTASTQFYFDYSLLRKFQKINLVVISGVNGYHSVIHGKTFGEVANQPVNPATLLYNTRTVSNVAAYIQVEKKFFNRLTVTGGMRLEFAMLDTSMVKYPFHAISKWAGRDKDNPITSPVAPLFRFGMNYQATEGTFIRASIGQGFRYPALSEKFVHTIRSGAEVFPNDSLRPETGWSAEIGIKQGVKISKWMAYFDVAGYIMQYTDMIEFTGFDPDSGIIYTGLPFKAVNVEQARIMGVEVSAVANGKIFGVPLNFLIGYSYLYPRNLNYNPSDPSSVEILKYRIQHSAKADIQTNYKGLTLGISAFFNSFIKNIDDKIGALKVVNDFRKSHNKGDFVMDVRAGYSYKEKATFMFICKNITNTEYTLRPGLIEPPRNFTFQVGYSF